MINSVPKPTRKKRTPYKILKDKCDKLWSLKIREKGYCELEGLDNIKCGGYLQGMHVDTRGKHAIRWNLMNGICGCQGHHVYYTYHEKAWMELVKKYFPAKYRFNQKHQSDIWDKDLDKVYKSLK
jgi:hypothetical protein